MKRTVISTPDAPQAIGTYSQAVRVGDTVYLSGQIPLVPRTMDLDGGNVSTQIARIFENISAVAKEAGGSLSDIVKLTVFLTDLANFPQVNEVMAQYFQPPYPARSTIGVASLPRSAVVEVEATMVIAGKSATKAAKPKKKAMKKKAKKGRR